MTDPTPTPTPSPASESPQPADPSASATLEAPQSQPGDSPSRPSGVWATGSASI